MGWTVVHVTQPTDAGVARCVADLAADQVKRGLVVTVVSPAQAPLIQWLRDSGVSHRAWSASREPGLQVLVETRRLSAILRELEPDVVHLHSAKAGLVGRLALRGRRTTVFQPHAWSFDAVSGPVARAALGWERFAARWADRIVCVSDAERVRGERAHISARWTVVPNGVNTAVLRVADNEDRATARHRLRLSDGPLVVCVGRLCRQKGQDVLLAAWPAVQAAVPGAELVLVGDGPDRTALAASAGGGVTLVGARDDVPDWLAAADVVAVPSRWEAMALTVLEAMARGRPVVASDVTGMRECIPPGAGAVVPAERPAALAAALIVRLTDPAVAAVEATAARAHVVAHHQLDRACADVVALYESILIGPDRSPRLD